MQTCMCTDAFIFYLRRDLALPSALKKILPPNLWEAIRIGVLSYSWDLWTSIPGSSSQERVTMAPPSGHFQTYFFFLSILHA